MEKDYIITVKPVGYAEFLHVDTDLEYKTTFCDSCVWESYTKEELEKIIKVAIEEGKLPDEKYYIEEIENDYEAYYKNERKLKDYLISLPFQAITSKRGNNYDVRTVDKKIIDNINEFKNLKLDTHVVNNENLYVVRWLENNKSTVLYLKTR